MKLIFCVHGNIKFFHNLIASFLTGLPSMPQLPKVISLCYLRNDMLDCPDFWYVNRPPTHENNLLYCQSKAIADDYVYLKKEGR